MNAPQSIASNVYPRFHLPGEQATMFLLDPFGNALEFKAFENIDQQFAKQ